MDKKGFVNIIIIGVVVVIIAAAGYFALMRKTAEAPATTQEPKTISETKDWKTYRNEEYGFEFKQPLNNFLQVEVIDFSKVPETIYEACNIAQITKENWSKEDDCGWPRSFSRDELLTWKEWIETEKINQAERKNKYTIADVFVKEIIKEEFLNINGIKILRGTYRSVQSPLPFSEIKIFSKNGDLIKLSFQDYNYNQKRIDQGIEMTKQEILQDDFNLISNQILSTFKFID